MRTKSGLPIVLQLIASKDANNILSEFKTHRNAHTGVRLSTRQIGIPALCFSLMERSSNQEVNFDISEYAIVNVRRADIIHDMQEPPQSPPEETISLDISSIISYVYKLLSNLNFREAKHITLSIVATLHTATLLLKVSKPQFETKWKFEDLPISFGKENADQHPLAISVLVFTQQLLDMFKIAKKKSTTSILHVSEDSVRMYTEFPQKTIFTSLIHPIDPLAV
eukprot:TRINITY_DN2401_c0_g2_i1.p1 TRINITY_DN2401_c0_g2~~TRINITY_DN2401_c0_g2_i1.p1  ORF type:complete len:224 (+),score=51.64 TRINITY_DN2401_c0_g2_i1:447-1118(+)